MYECNDRDLTGIFNPTTRKHEHAVWIFQLNLMCINTNESRTENLNRQSI